MDLSKQPDGIGLMDEVGGRLVPYDKIRVGMGWDMTSGSSQTGGFIGRAKAAIAERAGVDLDVVVVLSQGDRPVKYAGFDNLDPWRGSVVHSGDNKTGKGDGDDESVDITLSKVDAPIDKLVVVMGALKAKTSMLSADNVEMTVYKDGAPVVTFLPSLLGTANAVAMAKFTKVPADGEVPEYWRMDALEQELTFTQGNFRSLLTACQGL